MSHRQFPARSALLLATLACGLLFTGCTDNATRMSYAIERMTRPLADSPSGTTIAVPYLPKERPDAPYTVIFFPEGQLDRHDLTDAGVPEELADRIFRRLAYLDIGNRSTLVVAQPEERLHFTTHWRRFARVDELLVFTGHGKHHLRLQKQGDRWLIRGWD